MNRKKVLILGGGFAGIECAKTFKNEAVDVLLIDRQNHHLFQPLLYQVASAGLAAPEIAHPIRSIFFRQDNVTVLMDEVTAIDLENQKVITPDREESYDYLVLALGVKTGYFGHREWERHARGLKSLDDMPTLAELRDLDDIKVQLEFPGGAAVIEGVVEVAALPPPADDAAEALPGNEPH